MQTKVRVLFFDTTLLCSTWQCVESLKRNVTGIELLTKYFVVV